VLASETVPDTEIQGLVRWLPASLRPFALLARFDRPIGWWLLFWPCVFGLTLAGGAFGHWPLILWMLLGAIAMRGAGCVYNDIVDRDLDAKVARTASRPLASGAVNVKAAWIWLLILCTIGLIVLVQLRIEAQLVALCSLALVAAYPFMKRIIWWPQLWLGLVFSWGALVSWVAVTGSADLALLWLYGGTVFWVIGYDTIYAMQDREDDAMIGIRSSALRMGEHIRSGVAVCYLLALIGWSLAIWGVRPQGQALIALAPAAFHLAFQVATLKKDGSNALGHFRSNKLTGMFVMAACLVVGTAA
jgi:4-hydroxybenzoate polyprenyltransferase